MKLGHSLEQIAVIMELLLGLSVSSPIPSIAIASKIIELWQLLLRYFYFPVFCLKISFVF